MSVLSLCRSLYVNVTYYLPGVLSDSGAADVLQISSIFDRRGRVDGGKCIRRAVIIREEFRSPRTSIYVPNYYLRLFFFFFFFFTYKTSAWVEVRLQILLPRN